MKQRLDVCRHYICEGNCALGKKGTYTRYCQHCASYNPRFKLKHENKKLTALRKITKKDFNYAKSVIF